jgi:predicted phage tail protein
MQQVVRLLGDLGERYGAEHVYHNLRTPADAIKLLCINYPAFQVELITAHEKGIGYRVLQAGVDLNINDLHLPIGQNDLIVTPVLAGADGVGQFFAGAALIAAAVILAPVSGGASVGFLGATGTGFLTASASVAIGSIGASLVLGGVTQMLSPQPSLGGVGGVSPRGEFRATRPESVNRGFDGQQSYAYLGAQNTVGVGATIPVAYGKVLIGSHVISADVDVADESDPLKRATRTPGPDTVTVNGDKLEFGTRRNNMARWNSVHFLNDRSNHIDDRFNSTGVSPDGDPCSILRKDSLRTCTNDFRLEFTEGPTKDPKEYFVFLEVNRLFKFAAGSGTTKTDGFISYMIESRRQGTDDVHARESFTIQGLITDTYRWYHKFDPNKAPNIDFYNLDVTVLDASVDSSVEFVIRHGFRPSIS